MDFRARMLDYFRQRDRGWILSLVAAVFLVYLPFLGNPFFLDDLGFFMRDVAQQYGQPWAHLQLRWLPYASLAWTVTLFSDEVTHFFHLGNLLLHAANTLLLFFLLRRLIEAAQPGASPSLVARGAWLGALAFALHPVAVYAAGYVVQRSILMAMTFSLATQLVWLRALLTGRARWLALTVAFYFLAVFSKEHSVPLPAVLAMEYMLVRGRVQASRPALWAAAAAFAAIAVAVILMARSVIGTPYEGMAVARFGQQGVVAAGAGAPLYLLSVLTQAGLFFKYLLLWLIPNPAWMSVDMREGVVASLGAWQGWLGALGFVAYGALGLWLLLRRGWAGLAGFALLYPWLQFLLEFSSIRVQEVFVLYRSYLWMPGLMLLIPLVLAKWPGRKTLLAFTAAALLLAPLAVNRLWVFADPYRLWNDAALLLRDERMAGADRIYYSRGQAEEARGDIDNAIADFERAQALSPQLAPIHNELGWLYRNKGRDDDALAQFDAAIANDAREAGAYYGKAMILKKRHDDKQALELMMKSCELNNQFACLIATGRAHGQQNANN